MAYSDSYCDNSENLSESSPSSESCLTGYGSQLGVVEGNRSVLKNTP